MARKTSKSFERIESRDQLIAYARHFLTRSLRNTERALVVLDEGKQKLVGKTASGLEARFWDRDETLARPVIQHVLEKGEARLVTNSRKDPLFAGTKGPLSVLCVPVRDVSDRVIGVLYADNRINEGVFNDLDLDLTKKFAQEFSLRLWELPEAAAAPPEPPPSPAQAAPETAPADKPPPPAPPGKKGPTDLTRALVTALALVAVILTVAIGLLFLGAPKEQKVENVTPADAAKGFMAHALERDFGRAYGLLSEGMQKGRSRQRFESSLEEWMIPENEADLRARKVVSLPAGPSSGTVYLESSSRKAGRWQWTLVKEEDGWKLDQLTGGPKF